jgi:hypothetical protein
LNELCEFDKQPCCFHDLRMQVLISEIRIIRGLKLLFHVSKICFSMATWNSPIVMLLYEKDLLMARFITIFRNSYYKLSYRWSKELVIVVICWFLIFFSYFEFQS